MKKRIIFVVVLLLAALLSSCRGDGTVGFFDYQDKVKSVEGVLVQDGTDYGICAYFEKSEEGELRLRRIEYSSPESLEGLIFTLEGENITAELCGVRISDSYFEPEEVGRLAGLFSLAEEDIYSIESKKGNATVAKGKNESEVWQVTTDSEGIPTEISYESTKYGCSLKIDKLTFEKE